MAPDPIQLMGEALLGVFLSEASEHLVSRTSSARILLNEVTQPPADVVVQGHKEYSGFLFIVKNKIRRALLLEHRSPQGEREGTGHYSHHPSHLEENDFPGFG